MRIIETKVYKFDELPEDIKEKAIENLYDINVDYEWWQFIYEDAEQIGLEITEFDIDRASYCKGKFTLSAEEVAANIIKDHGKDCETFKTASSYLKEHDPIFSEYFNTEDSKLEDKLLELEDEFLKSLCEDYRIILSNEYEYLTSKEAIIETIKCNNYEFTEYGELA